LNKKQRRQQRQARRARSFVFSACIRAGKSAKQFLKKNWIAVLGIIVPVVSGFVIYYLTVQEPDIRFARAESITIRDKELKDNRVVTYVTGEFRFKNLSSKAGYVAAVDFIPTSLTSNWIVNVLDIEKVSFGWREEKTIRIQWTFSAELTGLRQEYYFGTGDDVTLDAKFYDNTGKQIGGLNNPDDTFHIVANYLDSPKLTPQPSR
jgi:hypothetical protein